MDACRCGTTTLLKDVARSSGTEVVTAMTIDLPLKSNVRRSASSRQASVSLGTSTSNIHVLLISSLFSKSVLFCLFDPF